MTDLADDSGLNLGHMVAIWEVSEHPEEGNLFDLLELEETATGRFGEATEDLCGTMTLRASSLPVGSYIIVCFPQEAKTPEVMDEPDAGNPAV